MSLFFILKGGGANGAFNLDLDNDAFNSIDSNGQIVTGTLTVTTEGDVDYAGDNLGNNEGHSWWLPSNTVIGSWECRLSNTAGTNQYVSGSGLTTEVDLTAGDATYNFSKAADPGAGQDSTVGTYLLEFSDDSFSTVHDSVSFTITLTEQAS